MAAVTTVMHADAAAVAVFIVVCLLMGNFFWDDHWSH